MYKRLLLKISGESLLGKQKFGIDSEELQKIAKQVVDVSNLGVQVVVVIGAGNIWRYRDSKASKIERTSSDAM